MSNKEKEKLLLLGMLSKAGKQSFERFPVLRNPEQSFAAKKYIKKHILDQSVKSVFDENNAESSKRKFYQRLKPIWLSGETELPKERQPFSKITSRQYYQLQQQKILNNNQKFGQYNPKYHYLFGGPLYQDQDFVASNKLRMELQLQQKQQEQKFHLKQSVSEKSLQFKSMMPNNDQVRQLMGTVDLQNEQFSNNLSQSQVELPNKQLYLGLDFDKPKRRVCGPVLFSKQVKKSLIFQ